MVDLGADGNPGTHWVTSKESAIDATYRRLRDPRLAGRTVSSIAHDAGFGDLSYFNRTFRRRYGVTPSGAREPTPGWRRPPPQSAPDEPAAFEPHPASTAMITSPAPRMSLVMTPPFPAP